MRDPHRTGDAGLVAAAGAHGGRGTREDEVSRVHVSAITCLGYEQRHVDAFTKALVCVDAELAHRLLIPLISSVAESLSKVCGVGEVERGRAVVHQWDVASHVLAE